MALQLFKIASVEIASPQSSIDFQNIPTGYTDLKLVWSGRSTNPYIDIKLNDSTSNRSSRYLYGNGSSAGSGTQAGFLGINSSTSNTSDTFGSGELYIPNYLSSNYKSFSGDSVQETNATSAEMHLTAGLWSDTSVINRVTIYPEGSGTFAANSTATLYGVL